MKHFISKAIGTTNCSECQKTHQIKSININELSPHIDKLMVPSEVRMLSLKRVMFETIYGNGNLLLNSLYAQYLICGTLILLGHFNDVCQRLHFCSWTKPWWNFIFLKVTPVDFQNYKLSKLKAKLVKQRLNDYDTLTKAGQNDQFKHNQQG